MNLRAACGGYWKKIVAISGNTGNKSGNNYERFYCLTLPAASGDAVEIDDP